MAKNPRKQKIIANLLGDPEWTPEEAAYLPVDDFDETIDRFGLEKRPAKKAFRNTDISGMLPLTSGENVFRSKTEDETTVMPGSDLDKETPETEDRPEREPRTARESKPDRLSPEQRQKIAQNMTGVSRGLQGMSMAAADFFKRRDPTPVDFGADTVGMGGMSKLPAGNAAINSKWLYDKYEKNPVTKNSLVMTENIGKMKQLLANPSGPGDMALVFQFMKGLDPTSTVREGEYNSAKEAVGWWNKIQNIAKEKTTGELFYDNKARKQFTDLMTGFYNAQMKLQREVYERHRDKIAPTIGADAAILDGLPFNFGGEKISKGPLDGTPFSGMTKDDLKKMPQAEFDAAVKGLNVDQLKALKELK